MNADSAVTKLYCESALDNFDSFAEIFGILYIIILFSGVGYLTAVIQKLTIVRLKDNVQLSLGHMMLEVAIVIVSVCFILLSASNPENALISEQCSVHVTLTPL